MISRQSYFSIAIQKLMYSVRYYLFRYDNATVRYRHKAMIEHPMQSTAEGNAISYRIRSVESDWFDVGGLYLKNPSVVLYTHSCHSTARAIFLFYYPRESCFTKRSFNYFLN